MEQCISCDKWMEGKDDMYVTGIRTSCGGRRFICHECYRETTKWTDNVWLKEKDKILNECEDKKYVVELKAMAKRILLIERPKRLNKSFRNWFKKLNIIKKEQELINNRLKKTGFKDIKRNTVFDLSVGGEFYDK